MRRLREWGWRVPFAVGAVMAFTVLLMRNHLHETVGPQAPSADAGSLMALLRHPKALFIVMSLTAGGGLCLYTFTTYMQKFLVNTAGMDIKTVSNVMLAAMLRFHAAAAGDGRACRIASAAANVCCCSPA